MNGSIWLLIFGLGAITQSERHSFIQFFGNREVPHWLMRGLRYVPPAVLSALVCPALLRPSGDYYLSFDNFRLVAGIIAALVAWKTKNILWTILSGLAALWLLTWMAS